MSHLALEHIRALRPKQWVKNVFVFGALVFAQRLTDVACLVHTLMAFGAFAMVSSSIYLVNDSLDLEQDKLHPTKRLRPIASGAVSRNVAWVMAVLFCAAGLGLAWSVNRPTCGVIASYFVMNLAYSLRLKHIALVDVFIIAAGFMLRVVAGAAAIAVPLSAWLLVTSFFLALFMAFGKRRGELEDLGERAAEHRANLADVTVGFVDQALAALTALTVMSYALYTIDPAVMKRLGTDALVLTVPQVLFGVLRYLHQVHRGRGGSPTTLVLTDRTVQLNGLVWLALVVYFIYADVSLGLLSSR